MFKIKDQCECVHNLIDVLGAQYVLAYERAPNFLSPGSNTFLEGDFFTRWWEPQEE